MATAQLSMAGNILSAPQFSEHRNLFAIVKITYRILFLLIKL